MELKNHSNVMRENNSISIVMLTYNNFQKFVRCMSTMTLFLTDDRIKEFLILDNGSHTPELISFLKSMEKQVQKFKVIFSDVNLGIAKGRKLLYEVATGDYIISFDSDVVVINPSMFLEIFYKTLDIENMMLVGGGGGDHPYFPCLERESIINHESPENPNELRCVDEVAGWFHGFKTSILKKNGGFLEMDEQFSPFWAEDSDLCVQIRLAGGKCCIMGKGLVGHQWSSCDKKETQVTLEEMWEKFQNKWYSKFGKDFEFDMDRKFYETYYPEAKNMINRQDYYLKVGMIKGHFNSKKAVHHLFPDVTFVEDNQIQYLGEKMSLPEFDMKYFNLENIVKDNFRVHAKNMPSYVDDLVYLIMENKEKGMEILKSMISLQKLNIVICVEYEQGYTDLVPFLEKYQINYIICSFPHFYHDLVPYLTIFPEINRLVSSKRSLNLSTGRDVSVFLSNKLSDLPEQVMRKEDLLSIDRRYTSIINEFISLNSNMKWNKTCCFLETTENLEKIISSLPVREILLRSLKVPQYYSPVINPRCSPKHALERVFTYVKNKSDIKPSLVVIVASIDDQYDFDQLKNNVQYFKNCKIVIFNKGRMKNVDLMELKCSHYYPVPENITDIQIWFTAVNGIPKDKYSNIIFTNDTYELTAGIDDFLELGKFKNCVLIERISEENKDFDKDFISVVSSDIEILLNELKDPKAEQEKVLRKMNFVPIWNEKQEEEEDEIVISYSKRGREDGADFPIE